MAQETPPIDDTAAPKNKQSRRKIPGNLPYTSSAGVLKQVLDKIPTTEKPSIFTTDFLGTVMQARGGSARPIPPILKATGMLSQSGVPTDLYSQFQTVAGRPAAALQALKNGFGEIFRRNQFANSADDSTLTDVVVAITGLPKSEGIVKYIVKTFQVFQVFAKGAPEASDQTQDSPDETLPQFQAPHTESNNQRLGLSYNINIVLPETTNVDVFNAIFKSLKGNLLI